VRADNPIDYSIHIVTEERPYFVIKLNSMIKLTVNHGLAISLSACVSVDQIGVNLIDGEPQGQHIFLANHSLSLCRSAQTTRMFSIKLWA
jgi:hypothetical protein